nr:hypothetical protein [Tanacetum cinerariifolium]
VSIEDANKKFLRSLPSSWSQVSLIVRTKPRVDTLSFDDLYNNLRVFESDVKGSTASSSSIQNVAFISSDITNSTNEVSVAYGVSTSSGHNSQKEGSSSYTDGLIQKISSQAASTSTVRKVNTARPIVNEIRPRNNVYKSHSPIRRTFNRTTTPKLNLANPKVSTVGDKIVSVVGGNRETVVKNKPHQTLKGKGIVDSRFSRQMTGNKAYLVEYQDFNGSPVAFGGSKGQITENIVPSGDLACLIAKATVDESNKWHRRMTTPVLLVIKESSIRHPPVTTENKANIIAGPKEANNSAEAKNRDEKLNGDTGSKINEEPVDQEDQVFLEELERLKRQENEADDVADTLRKTFTKSTEDLLLQAGAARASNTNYVNTASTIVNTASPLRSVSAARPSYSDLSTSTNQDDSQIPSLEDIYEVLNDGIFISASYDIEGVVADFTNLESIMNPRAHAFVSYIQKPRRNNHKDFQHCLFACFFSKIKPKKISQALEDQSWVDVMQEELLQFKTRQVWILVDLPFVKKVIETKWVYMNKKDERGILVRNKARLVAQGHRQEEGIDYDEAFAHVARIEAIRIFLAFASYMGFIVYQMDVKSSFLYEKIDEEVYVSQPLGFIDPKFPKKVYKVVKALYGLHQDPRAWFQISSMGELTFFLKLQIKQKEDGIFISQDKYVAKILKKFNFISVKTTSTLIETKKPLVKDAKAAEVDVHIYRSMIGSLMYLTASRPDIMYAVSACSRFRVTLKTLHLHDVKRIFRYLKCQPKLSLWYPRKSAFDLEAYSDNDYAGANLDRKSTTGGCQFLDRRLISWQCKKQTIVATLTIEAEYVAAASCCGQVLWIQNQMLDYGFNFMNTKIYIDNESTICIVKNPVFHSKTQHIEIRGGKMNKVRVVIQFIDGLWML